MFGPLGAETDISLTEIEEFGVHELKEDYGDPAAKDGVFQ